MNDGTAPFYFISVCDNFRDNTAEHVFDMLIERHSSFENYPIENTAFINSLIVNGFKYNQVDDHVVCEYCEAEIKNWSEDECIEYAHVTLSPYCAYANKIAERESFGDNITINAIIVKEGKPKCVYKCMSNLQSRMDTFVNFWPGALRDMITNIAEAGFFYTGRGDETVCFFCDCCVRDWHTNEDAWQRHVTENPQCYFVLSVKGKEFCQNSITVTHVDKRDDDNLNENADDIDEKYECKVCLERQRDAVLMPCRHFCVCVQCYFGLDQKCPTCRQDVTNFIKIFVV
ncbi:inhibitor of apoptosis - 1 [Rachiplusia ou multiple nucleopolyhedrovirus]|uniref:Inhibitor of apoptosis-1 n=1 Tax=Rachiplusia ou multiple nucleopolyhedrovirus (strain R1) TaxID=654904 RepID=Q8B9M2_NPVR1|nr:inhibitor of apoptosis - 1 [Rachiplusia ou multiple nucleopolyhedrovirus]AAN28066.1 inhibitor of apoptosis - 1 [Rachiplusia ou multiple nucleopolyhedrovirus]